MKKFFTVLIAFALVFAACKEPETEDNSGATLPSLTIKNESSYVLTDIQFSGITFLASNSGDLPPTAHVVKQLTKNDVNKTGQIIFTRKDDNIESRIVCRTQRVFTIEDFPFTFTNYTVVEEVANTDNRNSLSQITFLSQVTVERGGLSVAKNDSVNLGEVVMNTIKENEFTLKNTGTGKLLFSVNEPIKITDDTAGVFSVVQPSSKDIPADGSLTFKINFNPKAVQTYTATVTIESNDKNSPFTFTITAVGTPRKPIAVVIYEGNEISQNGTINADEVLITLSKSITVVIKNNGLEPLTIDVANITITGADASVFTKTTNPGGSVSANGGQTSFFIDCKPVKQGENNAVLTIPTNDGSRNPITILLKVIGVKGTPVPELSQGTTVITNNTLTPIDFGTVEVGSSPSTLTFTIKNIGNIALELTGDPVIVSSSAVFAISSQPASTIAPGASADFVIRYTPSEEGTVTCNITIANNTDAGQFVFPVKGIGYRKKSQIKIYNGETEIPQNGTIDAGETLYTLSKNITVTIKNTGEIPLTINQANITITGTDADAFSKTSNPDVSIQAGSSSTFTIKCEPVKVGENNAVLTIPSNDDSRNPAVVNLKIYGVQGHPVLALTQGSATITNNSLTPVDFETVELGNSKTLDFKIKNTGNVRLELTGSPLVTSSNSVFTVSSQPSSASLTSAAEMTFSIQYTPTVEGAVTGTITIANNSGTPSFSFTVKGTGYEKKPQIKIYNGETEISQNGTIDAGETLYTLSKNITVTIKNTGEIPLTIDQAITITGADADAFSKTTSPAVSIQAEGQTQFIIKCEPVKVGENNAVLIIPSNDSSRNPVVVNLKIYGVQGHPVLALTQDTNTITNNSLTPVDFGTVELGNSKPLNFKIKNTGNIRLELTGNPVVTSSNAVFTVSSQPPNTSLTPASETTFSIQYTPTVEGAVTSTIIIANNSTETPSFSFTVKGTGYVKKPQITVKSGTVSFPQNYEADVGSFLINKLAGLNFTITNTGEADLRFTEVNGNCINLENNSDGVFSVTSQPTSTTSVSPGNAAAFSISFTPKSVGSISIVTVKIVTNSKDDGELSFRLKVTGRNYIVGDTGPGGGGIFYISGSQAMEMSTLLGTMNWTDAVTTADNFNGGSFTNWHLPNRTELTYMYNSFGKQGLLGSTGYWSSEKYTTNGHEEAYYMNMYSGNVYSDDIAYQCRVVAVRSFTF